MVAGQVDASAVTAAASGFLDPETGRSVVETGQLRAIKVAGESLTLTLALSLHSAILREETRTQLVQLLTQRLPGIKSVTVNLAIHEDRKSVV